MEKIERLLFPIGNSDFASIRRQGSEYVDKTGLIAEVLRDPAQILLFPRPRRFGKTLNLSMLRYFFDIRGKAADLFKGLWIASQPEFLAHQGKYPVIFLSFKDVKEKSFTATLDKLRTVFARAYDEHSYLLESAVLNDPAKIVFRSIQSGNATQTQLEESLRWLTDWLSRHHGQPTVILLDEYDTPIHASHVGEFYNELIGMMRNLMGAAFKDNANLFKGIITGILRVSKEGMFSGLNNIKVYSLLSDSYAQHFGFTQQEVDGLLQKVDRMDLRPSVREWYNGFQFGNCEIYNPWSIINFFAERYQFQPYWVGTSDNALVKQILAEGSATLKSQFEALIRGESVEQRIDEYITLPSLFQDEDVAWSLLLFSGYLKVTGKVLVDASYRCTLKLPNLEIKALFNGFLTAFFNESGYSKPQYQALLESLVTGEIKLFTKLLSQFLVSSLSYFDTKGKEPERFYHGLVLGLLVSLRETHEVRSNRESGYGRYDVMIIPKNKAKYPLATIIEFKVVDDESEVEEGIQEAFAQIERKAYRTELMALGFEQIQTLVIVFWGKQLRLKVGG